jgi:predicted RNase H-like HicB family nuclease
MMSGRPENPGGVMQIPVLVERVKGNGYRARGTEPFAVTAKGATCEEALAKLRARIQNRLKEGTELVGLEIGPQQNPWLEFAGMFSPEDPLVQEWIQIMAENRRKMDEDPDVL